MRRPCRRSPSLVRCAAQQLALGVRFDSNADSNADELWRTMANGGELLTPSLNYRMNAGEPCRTLADDEPANFKTPGRHPWRCRRTDRSRRAPATALERASTQAVPLSILSATRNSLLRVKRSISEYELSLRPTDEQSDHLSPPIAISRCSIPQRRTGRAADP